MIKGIYFAAKNLENRFKDIEIVANNLANINTVGFKRQLPFSEILARFTSGEYKQLTDFTEGSFVVTGNPTDLAIKGNGFFVIQTENGMELTKNGRFAVSQEGFLVDQSGHKLIGQKGGINLQAFLVNAKDVFTVSKDGEIKVGDLSVDKLMVGKISDQQYLVRTNTGGFSYEASDFDIAEDVEYEVIQNALEEANVNPVTEMQQMIEMNKDFEATQKVVNIFDTHLSKVNELGRV
jgi:flagellar basal-body rod protein FlgG